MDWDPRTSRIIQIAPRARKEGMSELFSGFHAFLQTRDTGNVNRIPEMLTDNGVSMFTSESYPLDHDRQCQLDFTTNMIESAPKVIRKAVMAQQDSGWDEERLEKAIKRAKEEMQQHQAFTRAEISCHIGQNT